MSYLIKSAKIIAPGKDFHLKKRDILIQKGIIVRIASSLKDPKAKIIKSKNLHVSIGWYDIGSHHGEPGLEQRETFASLNAAAQAGGYTGLAVFPNTEPAVQTKSDVHFVKHQTEDLLVDFHPIAALSKDCAGKEITEMIDLHNSGAVAFSDGLKSVSHSGVLSRALEYKKSFGGKIIQHAQDNALGSHAQIHEGAVSISLGMQGFSNISEKTMVERDINISAYTESDIIFHGISAKESIAAIRAAKKNKQPIAATISYLNLVKEDTDLIEFDVNLKVLPPIRDAENRIDSLNAVKQNVIDAIVSNHFPLEIEEKKKEFTYASFGAIGIQTTFAALNTFCRKNLSLEKIIDKISVGPRKILGLDIPSISEGEVANLVAFDPDIEWTFSKANNVSISENSPFLGQNFRGKVIATCRGNKIFLQKD